MRAIIQRVKYVSVSIKGLSSRSIGPGLLILLGIEDKDQQEDIVWLSGKISRLRVFPDNEGMMNLSVKDTMGDILLISQFTLHASTKKGNRPSYIRAAPEDTARPLYHSFIKQLQDDIGKKIKTGEFGAYMQVELLNDGPVTIIIDSKIKE